MSDELVVQPGALVMARFEIGDRVARGGFATVWRAHDRLLGKDVALKVLRLEIADDPGAVEEMKRETLQSRELRHPHIVHTYDFVQDRGVVAIAMEYIDGDTLSTLASKRPNGCFDPPDISQWMADICDALEYAHSERGGKKPMVHHDIKPGNFMVDRHGVAKVLDFGISKTMTETRFQHTGKFVVAGTPPYMSPQQIGGSRPRPSDDIYSLGATMYALLTSKPPFYRGDLQLQISSDVPPSMNARRQDLGIEGPAIAPEWEEAIAACLAKAPEGRPATIAEVGVRLGIRESSSRRPVAAIAPVPESRQTLVMASPEPSPRRAWRIPALIAGGAATVVAVVLLWPRESPQRDAAPEVKESAPITRTEPPLQEPEPAAATPAGPKSSSTSAPTSPPPANPMPTPEGKPTAPNDDALLRATRIREVRQEIERAIASARWDAAAQHLAELRGLAPTDPDLATWTRNVREAQERAARATELSTAIPAAMAGGDWEGAQRLTEELRRLSPAHQRLAAWSAVVEDQLAVRGLVDRYRHAQEALDVEAYRSLWAELREDQIQKIRRSFADMLSQVVGVDGLTAEISGETANLRFHETRSYQLRAGGKQSTDGVTLLTLTKAGGQWRITARTTER